jgi:hypothetical protein
MAINLSTLVNSTLPSQVATAWVNFGYVNSSITIRSSYNISSVIKNSAGNYTINFTTSLTDANYVIVTSANAQQNLISQISSQSSSSFVLITQTNTGPVDSTIVGVTIFGS